MATIAVIRTAIAASLVGIKGVRWYDRYDGQTVPPAGIVRRLSTNYGVDFEGSDDHRFGVTVYLPLADQPASQDLLDELLSTSGARSIKTALEVDGTFGSAVSWANVESVSEEGVATLSGVEVMAATIILTVGD
jgi:hypothetical protein